MTGYIERERIYECLNSQKEEMSLVDVLWSIEHFPAADVIPVPATGIGDLSDGYHTFNGLYYQRMVLFAALVKQNKDRAWKSLRHEDGELCFGGGWFIVGIDTPEGSYTYHYETAYMNMFDCEELQVGKHWDGHTEKDVTRLLSLTDVVRCKECKHGENNCYVNGLTLCKRPIYGEVEGTVNTLMAESDFCSYGERK